MAQMIGEMFDSHLPPKIKGKDIDPKTLTGTDNMSCVVLMFKDQTPQSAISKMVAMLSKQVKPKKL